RTTRLPESTAMISNMTRTKLASLIILAAAAFAQAGLAAAGVAVAPDDKRLQYTGRIDFSNPQAPSVSWPETAIAGNFTGSSLAVTLDDQNGKNFFNVFIDGGAGGEG